MRSKPSSFETLCDILYLLIMIALSVNLLLKDGFGNPESRTYHLAGFMVVILILGDSFRFIPRITSFFIKDSDNVELVQDKGKIISSIVITLFYVFLWSLGIIIFSAQISVFYTILVYILAVIRIVLCLISQKYSKDSLWDIYRNLPFVFLVFVVGLLFFFYRYKIFSLVYAWVAIYFSLIFSMVVLFLSTKTERVGFWVIMRNLSLIWLISMFLNL
jgi:hypothetical protein